MKKFAVIMLLAFSSFSQLYATETWSGQNNEAVIQTQENNNQNDSNVNSNSNNKGGLDIFTNALTGGVAKYDENIVQATQSTTSKGTSLLYSLFFGSIGFIIFSKIILSLAALSFEPLRPILGATTSNSGGGIDGGSGKSKICWVSHACRKAIQECEGGSSSGGLGESSSGGKQGSLRKQLYLTYMKEEMFGIVCFFIAVALLLLPVGWDIITVIFEFLYSLLGSFAEGLRANIL